MNDAAIQIENLHHAFGRKPVLQGVNLSVPQGQTFAFLGRNGEGKTTTIQMMMGLLRPQRGAIRVLGHDPVLYPLQVRKRVGYLAEDQATYGWMRVSEMISFIGSFYEHWDTDLAAKLVRDFDLPLSTKCRHLSKGQSVRLGLLLALAHRPNLVILDDPTLGLDPVARKQFLRDVVLHLQGQGATVFFSSHLLYEVEPIADTVAILHKGSIIVQEDGERLRERVKQIRMTRSAFGHIRPLAGQLHTEFTADHVAVTVEDYDAVRPRLAAASVAHETVDLNLDEIFHAYVAGETHDSPKDPELAVERVA